MFWNARLFCWFLNTVILQQLPKCTSGSAISPQDLVANSSTQSNLVVAYKSFQSNSIIRQNITKPILSTGYSKPFKKPKKEHSLKGYTIQSERLSFRAKKSTFIFSGGSIQISNQ